MYSNLKHHYLKIMCRNLVFPCLLIFWLLAFLPLQAQDFDYAELKSSLEKIDNDVERLEALIQIAKAARAFEPDAAIAYAEEAIELGEKLGNRSSQALAWLELGRIHFTLDHVQRSIRALLRCEELLQGLSLPDEQLESYMLLSKLYQSQKRNKKALEYQEMAVVLRDSMMQEQTGVTIEGLKDRAIQAQQGKEQVMSQLQKQRENLLRKEAEIAKLEMEAAALAQQRAELEREKATTEMKAAQQALELNQTRARQNVFIGLGVLVLLLLFGLWQRYHYLQQRKQARFEQERAEQLAQIDRLKDQFLANTSHELRTPLNGIIGLAEALHDRAEELSLPERRDNLGMIISSGQRLSSLVDDILDFSKLRNAELTLNLKSVDIKSLVEVVIRMNESSLRGRDLKLINDLPEKFSPVLGDENRLQQILHNLIGNAIKFTQKGSIRISGTTQNGMLTLCVADTGIGIPKEKQAHVFREFEQGDGSTDRNYSGTGLGLAISQSLVELHGGKIWLESEEGKGSSFYFSLPISDQKAAEQNKNHRESISRPHLDLSQAAIETELTPVSPILPTGVEKINILLVDDEPINLQVLRHHLADSLYDITTALSGEEALAAMEKGKRFDMVLLDIMMPRMSGYELCQRIREKHLPSELPVIMITAKNQVKDLVEGLAFGANDYIAKPFSKQEFLARVKTHLNLSRINAASGRFVPHEFLRNLGHDTILDVKLGDEVEREVTVFFSDIRDYTSMSEGMSPKENFGFLNAYLGRVGPVIQENNGFINQFMGDGIMALFLKSADDAIKASIAMQHRLLAYNIERKTKRRRGIRVGMGMHTGPLVMGIIGDRLQMDATVVSDSVNTASRMEGLTKYYGANILASEATLSALEDPLLFSHRYLGKIQVKGKKTAIGVYEFFDGETEAVRNLKTQTKAEFEDGLRAFYEKSFSDAEQAFAHVLNKNPDDRPAQQYLYKCRELLEKGIPADWDGVERMDMK